MFREYEDLELGDMFICIIYFMFYINGIIWLIEEICRKIYILGNFEFLN